ncbi:MAG: hypothetical protein ACK496_13970 [Acidobacteriota bacterium]
MFDKYAIKIQPVLNDSLVDQLTSIQLSHQAEPSLTIFDHFYSPAHRFQATWPATAGIRPTPLLNSSTYRSTCICRRYAGRPGVANCIYLTCYAALFLKL